jgi:hypothetical protein
MSFKLSQQSFLFGKPTGSVADIENNVDLPKVVGKPCST